MTKSSKVIVQNPVTSYDFRWNAASFEYSQIIEMLDGVAKSYTFQLEEGDSGYLHYQGRLRLIKKRRKGEALKLFKNPPNYFMPTVNVEFYAGDAFYQMKEDTRVGGPWTDKDEKKYITQQLLLFKTFTLRPYQAAIYKACREFDLRKINLIYDPVGCCGKSLLSEWLEYEGLAEEVPPYRLMDDIFQWVCTRPIKKAYIVDMPRGMKKDRLGDFYSGIEVIKNGVAYDKRHSATKIRFDRPRIFVFTNVLPCMDLMSADRWVIWKILPNFDFEILQVNT